MLLSGQGGKGLSDLSVASLGNKVQGPRNAVHLGNKVLGPHCNAVSRLLEGEVSQKFLRKKKECWALPRYWLEGSCHIRAWLVFRATRLVALGMLVQGRVRLQALPHCPLWPGVV